MAKSGIDNALREAILGADVGLYALSKESGVHVSSLSRFVKEKRDLRLRSAAKVVAALGLDLTLERFLRNPAIVSAELEDIANGAQELIQAVGAKATHESYLSAIETAVTERSVSYARLLTGPYITHELHEHLRRVLGSRDVTIRKTKRDHLGHVTVTEREGLIVLPAARTDRFYGIRFIGLAHSRRFTEYFSEVFGAYNADSDQVRDERDLKGLCDVCSKRRKPTL